MGGNVFDNTSEIRKKYLSPTIDSFQKELSRLFPEIYFKFIRLGSVGKKKFSNDIDLGFSVKKLIKNGNLQFSKWNIKEADFNIEYSNIRSKSKTASSRQSALRAMLNLISDYINKNSEIIICNNKGTISGTLFFVVDQKDKDNKSINKTVQIDLNIGSIPWLKFSYYSKSYKDNVKGLHRTQLIISLFNYKGYIFKHDIGIIDRKTRENVASTPKKALTFLNKLYGSNLNKLDIQDYYKIFGEFYLELPKADFWSVIDIFLKILDSTRVDIPNHLQQYWLLQKDQLNLTGKFLPQNSKLCQGVQVETELVEEK